MTTERRALYSLLRMNWLKEGKGDVQPWQVEDYRSLSIEELFARLKSLDIQLDHTSFIIFADECDSPEELSDHLIADREWPASNEDQVYLLIFELWRRLKSEKPSLSIICNTLDDLIFAFDMQDLYEREELEEALSRFASALNENVDQGMAPEEAFALISAHCANDIETFLYDYILELIDEGCEAEARGLESEFEPYLRQNKWFKLIVLRLSGDLKEKLAKKIALEIIDEEIDKGDLEYNLELLSMMIDLGDDRLFRLVLKKSIPLVKTEENFQDLGLIVADYFRRLDEDAKEAKAKAILSERSLIPLDKEVGRNDDGIAALESLF